MALAHDIASQSRTDDIKINVNAEFTSLFLSERTLSGLRKNGFRKPSPIQQQAIPIGKCGFDLVIRSKSGTGKTAVFAIIALEMIDLTQNCVQCIIVAPTREIAVQIHGVIETIGSDYTGLKVHSFIGGMPVADDIVNLECCHIAVGAPGRLKHLIESGVLKTDSVKLLVLDEADKLMESSFYNDINFVYYKLPKCFQMIASSATYPNHLDHYISNYMHTPTHISALNTDTPLLLGLRQFVATVRQTVNSMLEKNRLLLKLLSTVTFTQCIVFSNYQTRVESVSNFLNGEGFSCEHISAAQTQPERLAALAKLKSFQCRIILSTDLTARGIDASNVNLIVNYDVPGDVCTYLHRMGRAGRYGSRGLCVTLAENGRELENFKKFIGFLGVSVAKLSNTYNWLSNDLWKGDLLTFEQISGVVTTINSYDDVKKSLFELKQYKIVPKCDDDDLHCNRTDGTSKLESRSEQTSVNSLLSNDVCQSVDLKTTSSKYSLESLREYRMDSNLQHTPGTFSKLCNVLEPLIKSSNLNEPNVSLILRRNCKLRIKQHGIKNQKNQVVNEADETSQGSNDSGSSKRKRITVTADNSPSNGLMHLEKRNLGDESVFQKNLGVLNVTRVLYDETTEISPDVSETIGQFLKHLKSGVAEVETDENLATEELVGNENSVLCFKPIETTQGSKERLFQHAFDYAVGLNNSHWLEQIDEKFDETEFDASKAVKVKENLLEDFNKVDFDAMEMDEDDEDYNEDDEFVHQDNVYDERLEADAVKHDDKIAENDEDAIETAKIHSTDHSVFSSEPSTSRKNTRKIVNRRASTRSVKVQGGLEEVVSLKAPREILNGSKFNRLYMECGENFLKTYKNFEEFEQFKRHWQTWRGNVESVRQYVQHKIYVQEMAFNDKFCLDSDSD